jgi:hypothetical protein
MAEIFESLNPAPSGPPRGGKLAEVRASDLSQVAVRASARQQRIVDTQLSPQDADTMPVTSDKFGKTVTGQVQGTEGVVNSVSNAAAEGATSGAIAGILGDELEAPIKGSDMVGTKPQDVEYGSLTPTQRHASFQDVGLQVESFATDPESGKMIRTETGAGVLSFRPPKSNGRDAALFLAEDGAPAHAALLDFVGKKGLRAMAVDGADGYTTSWRVHPDDELTFRKACAVMGADLGDDDGGFSVRFDHRNMFNKEFVRAPFGSGKKAGKRKPRNGGGGKR